MVGKIQVSYSELVKNQSLTISKLEDAYRHLSTGKSIERPGDQVVHFEVAGKLMNETLSAKAMIGSLQNRISWFQSVEQKFNQIQSILNDMSRLANQAADPITAPGDRAVYDLNFQENKKALSFIIDGEAGRTGANASFASMPLLLGDFIPMDLENNLENDSESNASNLFTNYAQPGQSNLSSLTSAATFDSQTRVQLPDSASDMANYYVGTAFTVISGAGKDQTAIIATYDSVSKVATLDRSLDIALKGSGINQSTYEIDLEGRFASKVWSADNRYSGNASDVFIPLTQAEINYRGENNISNDDFTVYTSEEDLARKELNIFSEEYGNINSMDRGRIMFSQVSNAKEQINLMTARVASKLGNLQKQVALTSGMQKWKDEGIGILEDTNIAEEMTRVQDLTQVHQKILELSFRLSKNYGKLNDLIDNKGVR